MRETLKCIDDNSLFNNYVGEIREICADDYNQYELKKYNSTLPTGIKCFEFGVMVGKRIERAKDKGYD